VVGEEEHHGELGQLGRLEAERPEADPAWGVVDRPEEEHDDEEEGREEQERSTRRAGRRSGPVSIRSAATMKARPTAPHATGLIRK